jgi:hypothetical protein
MMSGEIARLTARLAELEALSAPEIHRHYMRGYNAANSNRRSYVAELEAKRDKITREAQHALDVLGARVHELEAERHRLKAVCAELETERYRWREANDRVWNTLPPDLPSDVAGTMDASKWVAYVVAERARLRAALREWADARRAATDATPADVRVNQDYGPILGRLANAEQGLLVALSGEGVTK